jgi:hypothetical protein
MTLKQKKSALTSALIIIVPYINEFAAGFVPGQALKMAVRFVDNQTMLWPDSRLRHLIV